MKKQNINYKCLESFKTNNENLTEEELKVIFNKKYFKCIMRMEKNIFNNNEENDLLENKK